MPFQTRIYGAFMRAHWQMNDPDQDLVDRLIRKLDYHPATAAVLVNRHISTPDQARDFLNVALYNLRSHFALKNVSKNTETQNNLK